MFARETGAAIGGAIGRVGSQVGEQIDNHIAGQLIGNGMVTSSQLTANLTKQVLDTMTQAPLDDYTVGQGQRENVNKSIQAFQDSYADAPEKVQNWALTTADHMREHFGNSITAYEMQRAGGAATQNLGNMARANQNSVSLDPASLEGVITKQQMDFDAYMSTHPNIGVEASVALKKELEKTNSALAYTAAQSIGRSNPTALNKVLSDGTYDKYLDPEQKERLIQFAQRQEVFAHTQKEWDRQDRDQKIKDNNEAATHQFTTDLLNGKSIAGWQNNPNLTTQGQDNIKSLMQSQAEFGIKQAEFGMRRQSFDHEQKRWSDNEALGSTMMDVYRDSVANPNNVGNLQPAWDLLNKTNNPEAFKQAYGMIKSLDSPVEKVIARQFTAMDAGWKKIGGSGYAMFASDPDAYNAKVLELNQSLHDKIEMYRKNNKDITPLITPGSKEYWASPEHIASVFGSSADQVAAKADKIRAGGRVQSDEDRWMGATGGTLKPGQNAGTAMADWLKANPAPAAMRSYRTQAEADKAGLKPGTRIIVNGVPGTWQP